MSTHLMVPRRLGARVPASRSLFPGGFGADVDLLFDRLWRGFAAPDAWRSSADTFDPRVDVSEGEDEIRFSAELPGLAEEDFEVVLEADRLTIKGEKKDEREEKREGYHRVESLFGSFERSFRLPEGVDPDAVTARYD